MAATLAPRVTLPAMRKQRKDMKERKPKLRISRQRLVFTAPIPSSPMRIVDRVRASKA